ncbi:PAS domain S-box-containing protein [Reichenbachiella faecimaris]|uniref:histidine kinase n=2 Tax=Reichenbachiella faecimaris TaxID=692418 RepID=A0A1W2GHF2_REIFA|nr:PAS domain S-box-containing protein [Reichenbachiella faecimaris]
MELILTTSNIVSALSLIILFMSLWLMMKIYKNMNGRLYGGIWWSSFLLLLIFTFSEGALAYYVWVDRLALVQNEVGAAMLCSAIFTLVVIYAGLRTTKDLKQINISKHYLDKIMHSMGSYLVVTDPKLKIQKVNKAICQELGMSQKELIGQHLNCIFRDNDLSDLADNHSEQTEVFIESKNGDKISVLLSKEPICNEREEVYGFVFQAFINHQKEIQHLYSFFRSILNNSNFAIVATDTFGVITGMNPAVERYFGYKEEEVLNQISPNLFHSDECIEEFISENNIDYPEPNFSVFTEMVDNGQPISKEMIMRKRDGTLFPALITVNAIKNQGETTGYFEIIADISEKREAEEALKKANAELKDFAHIVSHDLKAPLRAIGTLASWLRDDYAEQLDSEGQEQFNLLMGRVTRMEGLINGILEYSKVGRKNNEAAESEDIKEIIAEVADAIVPQDKIDLVLETSMPSIAIDRTRAQQIFQNIISNAVKYMDKEKGEIKIACHKENGFWTFSVADNGPGIEKQYFDKIFQIFQTLKPRDEYESTGVGLAIVKKSVELYGGEVWLDSDIDLGTTFYFTLPEN